MRLTRTWPATVAVAALLLSAPIGCKESGDSPNPDPVAAPRTAPLALTPTEYNNTIADLFGLPRDGLRWPARPAVADKLSPARTVNRGVFFKDTTPRPPWPWRFPAERGSEGFEGIASGQSASAYQIEEINNAAMHFGSYALVSPYFFSCTGWAKLDAKAQESCAWTSLQKFAQRAYRRPVTKAEMDRLQAYWRKNLASGDRSEAVALTVAGILQTPAFLFKIEARDATDALNGVAPLTHWEMASRLSYFLWDTMPDPQLFAAAAESKLGTAAEIRTQAKRMLTHNSAHAAVIHFHHQWLGTDKVVLITPARRAFGPLFGLTAELGKKRDDDLEWPPVINSVKQGMKFETELFVEHTIFDGAGTFKALMTDNHGFMSTGGKGGKGGAAAGGSSAIYGSGAKPIAGLPPVTRTVEVINASIGAKSTITLVPTTFPATERAGVLTLPAVLALGAYAVQPGPILRGKLVLERLACMDLGTPVQGAEAALPPDTLTAKATNRERTHNATKGPACKSCHVLLNPPGFAFENYDALGKYRTKDNGQTVDATGSVMLEGGETISFADGVDFARKLAVSKRVKNCYALHWTRYALGNHVKSDATGLAAIQQSFQSNDSIKELLVSIAASDLFRNRQVGGAK